MQRAFSSKEARILCFFPYDVPGVPLSLAFVTAAFDELVNRYQETWWHEVIVLAAGVAGGGSGAVSGRLLRKDNDAAIFLAAQCLETETDMKKKFRTKIEEALGKLIPPKNEREVTKLKKHGPAVAPILAKSLRTFDALYTMYSLLTLAQIDYDPAIPAIALCVSDSRIIETPEADFRWDCQICRDLYTNSQSTSLVNARAASER